MKNIGNIALLSASLSSVSAASAQTTSFRANLNKLNNSGVSSTVLLNVSDDEPLTATVDTTGFEPNQPHGGHIQRLFSMGEVANSQTPTLEQDADGGGLIELSKGASV